MPPYIVVIILNWNNARDTLECLESVAKFDYPNYTALVVDNGSTDDSVARIQKQAPHVQIHFNNENLGYADGNNRGIELAWRMGADYVFVINNDTEMCADILTQLLNVAEADQRVGAVGPKIYYHDHPRKIWFAGGRVDWQHGFAQDIGNGEDDLGQYEEIREVDYLSGCALLIKRNAWEKVGPLDARFFMYYEETDWCTRAHRQGYSLQLVPQAKMWHKVSWTQQHFSPRILYYMTRNCFLFFSKNLPFPGRVPVLAHCIWNVFRNQFRFRKTGQREQAQALLQGLSDFFSGRFGRAPVIAGKGQP
jgi:GT2 family glycosyltransferase